MQLIFLNATCIFNRRVFFIDNLQVSHILASLNCFIDYQRKTQFVYIIHSSAHSLDMYIITQNIFNFQSKNRQTVE